MKTLPVARDANREPHLGTRLPGAPSKYLNKVKSQQLKLSVGTWAALVSPARRGEEAEGQLAWSRRSGKENSN